MVDVVYTLKIILVSFLAIYCLKLKRQDAFIRFYRCIKVENMAV